MNNDAGQTYKQLTIKFLNISLREQMLILFSGLIVVILMMNTLALEPIFESSEKLQKKSHSADKEMRLLKQQVAALTDKLKANPNNTLLEKLALLKRQNQKISGQLKTVTENLVPANKMAGMLESVLSKSKGLTLIELQSIAPIPVSSRVSEADKKAVTALYRHGVTFVFEGNYKNIQRYLETLESLPWQFYWQKFDYSVVEHPIARVELEIYTLSTNKAFIGG
jgi:MSHA biogenesis protein MshJ|tara:strand:+ start:404 stop:1075 length:672 start_codon:yes stop_codon:yes gene_type:complete